MLIDASHPEETRVVVIDGSRLDDLDLEVSSRRQLKGNIYLAKVTRVEPSLQAAFVNYGGNRHGFLAFNEIHPDYYQIPVADREALLAEHEAAQKAADLAASEAAEAAEAAPKGAEGEEGEAVADLAGIDEDEDIERQRPRLSTRPYKIQEVIKRRQIMLVQVVKEERGNKGAALTTYLSLAGRCCVLMPNTARGGGISRKITNVVDRRRLKKIVAELEVPQGMTVIVRTAGAGRSKAEIRRDYEYLLRLWSNIRETTLGSMAPALVYEEGSLIKRSIRDLYGRDIEEIIIQGEPQYRIAKEFMKLFTPSHAKKVKLYDDPIVPLFHKYAVEGQLEAMHQMTVHLKSGGYIVINPTEALVAIDVNSGRATRERHIEETALRTNLEAADEIARNLRLRDLAGLIVIDFIDMEVARNQAQVERRLKEAMKNDKARIQLGRISSFGLLELSRQRLRPSVLETSFEVCPACSGIGVRRTTESAALAVLRKIEEEGILQRASELAVSVPTAVAIYLLNHKRRSVTQIEERYGLSVQVQTDDTLLVPDHRIERLKAALPVAEEEAEEAAAETAAEPEERGESRAEATERDEGKRSRRRRPRRKRRPGEEREAIVTEAGAEAVTAEAGDEEDIAADDAGEAAGADSGAADADADAGDEPARKRRRRGKRGGRRRARRPDEAAGPLEADQGEESPLEADQGEEAPLEADQGDEPASEAAMGSALETAEPLATERAAVDDASPISSEAPAAEADDSARAGMEAEADIAAAAIAETLPSLAEKPASEGGNGADDADAAPANAMVRHDELVPNPAPPASEAAKTPVIRVGSGGEAGPPERTPRRGWWQRLLD
jgi:ribonuclease E